MQHFSQLCRIVAGHCRIKFLNHGTERIHLLDFSEVVPEELEALVAEAKKIIHTLEDEQRAERDLTSQNVVHRLEEEVEQEPVIKHTLVDDLEEELGMDLIPTTNYIKNFNVFYEEVIEEVAQVEVSEDDFVIIDSTETIKNIEVVDPQELSSDKEEDQFALGFDLPLVTDSDNSEEEKSLNDINKVS